jgi:cytochrome P450
MLRRIGEQWYQQRKTAANIFNKRNFSTHFTDVFITCVKELVTVLDAHAQGPAFDMQQLFFSFTFESFIRIGFGQKFNAITSPTAIPFAAAFDKAQRITAERFLNPFWRITEGIKSLVYGDEMQELLREMENVVYSVIYDRRQNLDRLEDYADILSLFMQQDDGTLSDQDLRDVVLNFIIAGRDTTAQALTWAVYNLCRHPDIQQRLYESVKDVDWYDGEDTYTKVKGLKYAQAVFSETLRLHPSVPFTVKLAQEDDVLPNGAKVLQGEVVAFSTYCMGRLTRLWGPDAKQFRPERWLNPDATLPSQYDYPVFNAGPRVCLGKDMATFEGVLCMSMLAQHYEFELAEPGERTYDLSVTLPMKHGLPLFVKKRS